MAEQLSLPYEIITTVANRQYIRDNFKIGARVSYWIPFKDIGVRDGFNHRYDYGDIRSLADWIYENKRVPEPFVLDVLPDARNLVDEGHRRKQAIELLISENKFDHKTLVEFFPNKSDKTELQRTVNQIVSNNHRKPLTPLEQSSVVFDIKHNFNISSNQEIGNMIGVSRQTVDNLLLISEAGDDVKNQIKVGNMSFTDAVAFVRAQRKQSKEADKAEEESHKTQTSINLPQDALKDDIADLAALEEKAEEFKKREAAKEARDLERLLDVANEVLVSKESLLPHIGKRFAAPAYGIWSEDFADADTGEIVNIERQQLLLAKDQEVNDAAIDLLIANNAKSVYIYKVHTAAPSVLTEFIDEDKKVKGFDESRPEIKSIQDAIKAGDKIEAIVSKLDVPDQVKQDLAYQTHWLQKNLADAREWIHKHKQENKMR